MEQERMKQVIASIRTPTGYMRSLKGAFTKIKKGGSTQLYGLKSHDWHKILQVIKHFFWGDVGFSVWGLGFRV